MKNKAQFNLFSFIIIAFLTVVFFGGLIYAMGLINNVMYQAGLSNEVNAGKPGYTNMTLASEMTFGRVNDAIQQLRLVAMVYILSLATLIIVTNSMIRVNPIWFFAYILLVLLAVIFAPLISNAYENLLNSNIFAGELSTFTASNFILLNLPTLVLVVGILGGIFLFFNLIRQEGGGLG